MNSKLDIDIIAIGKLKEEYLRKAEMAFVRNLGKYSGIRLIELKDEKTKDGAGEKELKRVKDLEGQSILKYLDPKSISIAMDISGKKVTSTQFRDEMDKVRSLEGKIQFVIGGSLGLSENVLSKVTKRISFGEMTYPHQLFRIMLLEEIMKCFEMRNLEERVQ
jgi:23S rRNA (pseudouridine1915-N3)-methyltransferase